MFEKFVHQTPFLRLVIPLILGILVQINFRFPDKHLALILISFLILIVFFQALKLNRNYALNKTWGIFISLFLFMLGVYLVSLKQEKEHTFQNNLQTFIATVIEQPEEKENSIKTKLRIDLMRDTNHWNKESYQILCYFEKDSSAQNLELGDQIVARAYINEIKHTGNPYAFNYKEYLSYQEIYNQCFIKSGNYRVTEKNKGSKIRLFSNRIRQRLLSIYSRNNIHGDEFAVLSALTLGYKSELTPELKESFSTSGAMHILAVSGLHVGIIYIILCKLLFFLQRNKYGKYLQSVIIILVLFFYAFLTGLSDSVFRATIMFTFISIGKIFTRQVSIYNSIAASAFILLLINPYSAMNVGFQLSYAAVLSIVFFQPKLYSLLNVNNTILDYIWQLVSVSIAAQIGTFPITIFYFGQFPLYFILTNILIIPLATIIIYGAFILIILSFSNPASLFVSSILSYVTYFLNKSIGFIEELPYSKINQFHVNGAESILWIAVIITISFFIITKRFKYFRFSIILSLIVFIYNICTTYLNSQKSIFIVHHISKSSVIHVIKNSKAQLFTTNETNHDDINIKYNVSPLWKNLEIKDDCTSITILNRPLNYFKIDDKKAIQIQNDSINHLIPEKPLKVDYIILSCNANVTIDKLTEFFDFKLVIFDSSNHYYQVQNWEKECRQNNTPYYNVLDKGAYIENL